MLFSRLFYLYCGSFICVSAFLQPLCMRCSSVPSYPGGYLQSDSSFIEGTKPSTWTTVGAKRIVKMKRNMERKKCRNFRLRVTAQMNGNQQ